jgi:ketosteroid isomerase-like protein
MRSMLSLLITWLLGLLLVAGQERSSDSKLEKEKIRLVLGQYVKALESENVKQLSQLFAEDDDLVTVNVHIPGIVLGPERLKATAKGWFDAVKGINVVVSNEVIKMNQAGNAAWISFTLDGSHSLPDRQERFEFKGMRVTWGLEKREGKYLIVQGHWSFVSKDQEK